MIAIQRTNTILYCNKWAETVAFYREQLQLPVGHANDWFVEFHLGATSYLSVADSRRATIHAANGDGLTLSWQVADLLAAAQQLAQAGIAHSPIRNRWGAQVLYFHDPEGNRLELWSPIS
jgi:catechol 2,3-dioxygenase-like lactoylglutathione lyase family enzyme